MTTTSSPGAWTMLALTLLVGGCTVSDRSTIGGRTETELTAFATRAAEQCAWRGAANRPDYRFTTDGCSMFPDGGWQDCCVDHDILYWCGGTEAQRAKADDALRTCVEKQSSSVLGALMRAGVAVGGAPWLPVPWRWGYGYPWPRPYDDPR
jgi:hypothetical protein